MSMFNNRKNAEDQAKKIVAKGGAKLTKEQRENVTKTVADQLERKADRWTRDNVGLD